MTPPATDRAREILAEIRARRERGQALPKAVGRSLEGLVHAPKLAPLEVVELVAKAPGRWKNGRRGRRGFAGFFNRVHHTIGRTLIRAATGGLVG